jgi:hypothetical protein
VVARRRDTLIASGTNESASLQCETGEVAVGGGAGMSGLLNGSTAIYLRASAEGDEHCRRSGQVRVGNAWNSHTPKLGSDPAGR